MSLTQRKTEVETGIITNGYTYIDKAGKLHWCDYIPGQKQADEYGIIRNGKLIAVKKCPEKLTLYYRTSLTAKIFQ